MYAQYKLRKKIKLKNTEFLCKSIISLPFNDLNKKRFNLVKKYLKEIIRSNKKVFLKKRYKILFIQPIASFSGSLKSSEEYIKNLYKKFDFIF